MGSALASRLRLEFAVLGFDVARARTVLLQATYTVYELATAEGCGRLDDAAVAKLWKQWLGTSLATKSADEA
jgi:hypothetical protein